MALEKKVSSLIALDELKKSGDLLEVAERVDAQSKLEFVRNRAIEILSLLAMSTEFKQLFLVQSLDDLSAFVYTYKSRRTIVIDLLARCPRDQMANCETYKFASHPEFEKKIAQYTRTAEKPNNQLAKCRPWDVALNLVVKIEALDSQVMQQPNMRLLFRENLIAKHMWDYYMRENMELDEMTGIPIIFKYEEMPNPVYNYDSAEYKVIDIHGNMVPWKPENRSTLSYLCMERLGPNVQYLMDVMIAGKRRGFVFDFDTAFKIFDQLLCRCLQMHRFDVIHNSIQPDNVYFGRNICYNVLYVANFNLATVFDTKDHSVRKLAEDHDPYDTVTHMRFVSHMRMKGASPHPVHDLESAFYMLIASITNNLPWDNCFKSEGGAKSPMKTQSGRSSASDLNASNNQAEINKMECNSLLQKLKELKTAFWKQNVGLPRILTDLQFMATGNDRFRVTLACDIIKELYARIRDLLATIGSDLPRANFFTNLLLPHTNEYQIYTDLRRTALMLFRFESVSAFINTPTYQKKIESIAHDESDGPIRMAWNLTNWCFNSVEVNVTPAAGISAIRSAVRNNTIRTAD